MFKPGFPTVCQALLIGTLPLALVTTMPSRADAASFVLSDIDEIYVFGDSLVDTGNLFAASSLLGSPIPSSPPYFAGRFSNGPLWVENLAATLGLNPNPQTNFGFAGSGTGQVSAFPNVPFPLPGLLGRVNAFTATTPVADPTALYVLAAGSNDYLFGGVTNPNEPIANLSTAVSLLARVGAKNILVTNLPDLGKLPAMVNTPVSGSLSTLTRLHNAELTQSLVSLDQTLPPDVNVLLLDQFSLFDHVLSHSSELGFTNVTTGCLSDPSCVPDRYLFWDDFHPSAAAHRILANTAFSTLEAAAVPEPASTLGALTFGALATGWRLKRRQRDESSVQR
jgi:phospholipase/lecithinase/hemolysin